MTSRPRPPRRRDPRLDETRVQDEPLTPSEPERLQRVEERLVPKVSQRQAGAARYAIIAFAVVAAVDQLGIAETVVNTLFVMTIGAIALAFALAFGLGGQQVAQQVTQSWYTRGQDASQKVARYAERKQADSARVQAAGEPASDATVRPVARDEQR